MPAEPKPLKFYDFDANRIIIGGIDLSGFGEDGGVEYEQQSPRFEHANGADGQTTLSRTNDPRVVVTITFMETGDGYARMMELHKQQGLDEVPLTYQHIDPKIGDRVQDSQAVFLDHVMPNKSRTAGEREFTLILPNAAPQLDLGTNLT